MLVIFEAFWLPLAEQSCRKLWLVSITQQCLPSPPACWAGVVFQPVHHVQCAPAFPRKLERFISKALFHNKVSAGYIIGKVRSQMAAVQERPSSGCGAEPAARSVWGRWEACTPAAQCGVTEERLGTGWGEERRISWWAVTSIHPSWPLAFRLLANAKFITIFDRSSSKSTVL